MIDVDRNLLYRETETAGGKVDNADIGLMGDDPVDVIKRQPDVGYHCLHIVAIELTANLKVFCPSIKR